MDDTERLVTQLAERLAGFETRLKGVENNTKEIPSLTVKLDMILQNQQAQTVVDQALDKRIRDIEQAPAKEWKSLKFACIGAVVTVVASSLFTVIMTMPK